MKKIILIITVGLMFSCNTTPVDINIDKSHRIIGKESNVFDGYGYQIVEVDGVEYLTMSGGGIYPLIKDTLNK